MALGLVDKLRVFFSVCLIVGITVWVVGAKKPSGDKHKNKMIAAGVIMTIVPIAAAAGLRPTDY